MVFFLPFPSPSLSKEQTGTSDAGPQSAHLLAAVYIEVFDFYVISCRGRTALVREAVHKIRDHIQDLRKAVSTLDIDHLRRAV